MRRAMCDQMPTELELIVRNNKLLQDKNDLVSRLWKLEQKCGDFKILSITLGITCVLQFILFYIGILP